MAGEEKGMRFDMWEVESDADAQSADLGGRRYDMLGSNGDQVEGDDSCDLASS